MKKFLLFVVISIICYIAFDFAFYYNGQLYIPHTQEVECLTKADDGKLWINKGNGFEVFEIRGVNLGLGKPGKFATDYSITKEEYKRWFSQIQELGANVIRIYTIAHEDFYKSFYEFNANNPTPLYLIHGVWVDDYLLNSRLDAFDDKFYNDFLNNCKDAIDIIHGRHKRLSLGPLGKQTYKYDISPWVYGYIIGVEWETDIVAFTNNTIVQQNQLMGEYLYTENATNFEIFLASVGNEMIKHETNKYGSQRSLAFSNGPTTDPLEYPENISIQFEKYAKINVENIKSSENFIGGQYASYHIYPYYPEYEYFINNKTKNSYLKYLIKLNIHHQQPVVISEFGIPSSRGMASYEQNKYLGRNQGYMSEYAQGQALVSLYEDIIKSGCAGGIVFLWQDEWFKRTWNTIPFVDLNQIVFWSDYQTNEQAFGLLSFDPGVDKSICYVDGDKSDWTESEIISNQNGHQLSVKYDEKFIYFLISKKGFDYGNNKIFIPIDLTPKSGSTFISHHNIKTTFPTDFLIEINKKNNSRLWIQSRYNTTKAIYGNQLIHAFNQYQYPPEKDSSLFGKIELVLHELNYYNNNSNIPFSEHDFTKEGYYTLLQTYETGKLTYGNSNPNSIDFNSLADFCFGYDFVEIKLPWQLLNFSDPSQMRIHDDYYTNYGVEQLGIDHMNIGVGDGKETIEMCKFKLIKLGRNPMYHERLKQSYYILQKAWKPLIK